VSRLVPDPRDHSTRGHYAALAVTAALGLAVGPLWKIVE